VTHVYEIYVKCWVGGIEYLLDTIIKKKKKWYTHVKPISVFKNGFLHYGCSRN